MVPQLLAATTWQQAEDRLLHMLLLPLARIR
jgi:hypothetical protein